MQTRYLGDTHDFIKYALLRKISARCGLQIGLNWYLTDPTHLGEAENSDGEKRHHLNGGVWNSWDSKLLNALSEFSDPEKRELQLFEASRILPETCTFFREFVPIEDRSSWHRRALDCLDPSEFVFLDPDNGFIVKSATRSRKRKYATYSEVSDYFRSGKSVCSIQFARQCDPNKRANEVRERLHQEKGFHPIFPVLRGRVAPNILFVFLVQQHHAVTLLPALEELCEDSSGKAELIY